MLKQHLITKVILVLLAAICFEAIPAQAATKYVRWTNQYNMSDDLEVVLAKLNQQTGLKLSYNDFQLYERRDMAHYRFSTYLQLAKGVPVQGAVLRTWLNPDTGTLVQLEAHLDDGVTNPQRLSGLQFNNLKSFKPNATDTLPVMPYVRSVVAKHADDPTIGEVKFQDMWVNEELARVITVKARRGVHTITVSHFTKRVIESKYQEYPQADIQALVYPIYEETANKHTVQQRVPVTLQNISLVRKTSVNDPYAPLQARHYYENMVDINLAETAEGQAKGYWSFNWLMRAAKSLFDAVPYVDNTFDKGGMYLEGQYATVSLHPGVKTLKGLNIPITYSGHYNLIWTSAVINGNEVGEVIPSSALFGAGLRDEKSALGRNAQRLPDHNMVSYINDGFDEIQVYYAINQLMTSMHRMGFTDPELSSRPFNAFLYDPDISMRDNAYYQNDTINFTTYSPNNQNFARDNSTIWHELGHGVMDRLMGDLITLADSGGLSEGMADFVAQLVVQDVTEGKSFDGDQEFRIVNRTGFNLTNEAHDDGEAYGGTMKDIMDLSLAKFGRPGLAKMTDLTLETMRLARNHPALTANDWFEHMLFADQLGQVNLRAPGEMHDLIISALNSRNYRLDRGPVAQFTVKMGDQELTNVSDGSRGKPIVRQLKDGVESSYNLTFKLVSSDVYPFKYPVTLELNYEGGPLEGSLKWKGKENGAQKIVIEKESDTVNATVTALGTCSAVNRPDGGCSDYVYMKVYNAGENHPAAKKRFYVRLKP